MSLFQEKQILQRAHGQQELAFSSTNGSHQEAKRCVDMWLKMPGTLLIWIRNQKSVLNMQWLSLIKCCSVVYIFSPVLLLFFGGGVFISYSATVCRRSFVCWLTVQLIILCLYVYWGLQPGVISAGSGWRRRPVSFPRNTSTKHTCPVIDCGRVYENASLLDGHLKR